uniref:Uncharacterized protein n=1 Tax=Panagrolaimus davidi TaxID=227884 RepID=A0A914PRZ4_9BILA
MRKLKQVSITSDGQFDSPGFCAQMCRVVTINSETGFVVAFKALQKYMTDNRSSNMELAGTKAILNYLEQLGINVTLLTTDRHVTVRKMMETHFPKILHLFDTWHLLKSLTKDLREKTKTKRSGILKYFVKPIKNHAWFSVAEGKGDGILAREILLSALFHISLEFTKITSCCHPPIDPDAPEKEHMDPASWAYYYLFLKLSSENLLADFTRLSPDFATSKVENFNSLATGKYCPKKTFFPLHGYIMRSMLAILHYNNNVREEKAGNRKILRYVWQDSKANPGERIKKAIKSKASTEWQHNIVTDCIQVISNGFVFDNPISDASIDDNSDEEEEYLDNEEFEDDEFEDGGTAEYEEDSDIDLSATENKANSENYFDPPSNENQSKAGSSKKDSKLQEDGFEVIDPSEMEKTSYSAPKFIPPTLKEIQNALHILGIPARYADDSP